ncbi:MAG: hypothetical protein NC340_03665 [Ruminococcus flavefaciens]|nr:hypothetical protein [Ruminococcus flavefaciens]MCM1229147.1 hypothetical protein [Ruminococcus flavefaciens]
MKINENFAEQPNHAHYMACLKRKGEIDSFSRKVFFYTIAESAVFLVMIFFGLWLSALSWIPSLCGEPFTMPNITAYFAEIILIPVIALAGCGKYKICDIILFAVHCVIILGCFFGGLKTLNTFPLAIGVIGAVVTYPSISAYLDYRQLMQTEGFPQFNNLLAQAEDNPEFISDYSKEYHNKGTDDMFIQIPDSPVADMQSVSTAKSAYMDDININNDSGI